MLYPVRISMRPQAGNRRIDKDKEVKLRIHNGTQVNFRTMMSRLKVFLIDKYRKASYVKR